MAETSRVSPLRRRDQSTIGLLPGPSKRQSAANGDVAARAAQYIDLPRRNRNRHGLRESPGTALLWGRKREDSRSPETTDPRWQAKPASNLQEPATNARGVSALFRSR